MNEEDIGTPRDNLVCMVQVGRMRSPDPMGFSQTSAINHYLQMQVE
jgi:hypothetical protein